MTKPYRPPIPPEEQTGFHIPGEMRVVPTGKREPFETMIEVEDGQFHYWCEAAPDAPGGRRPLPDDWDLETLDP